MEVPTEYGYTYPDEIFNNIDVLTAESVEQELYMDMLGSNPALGGGELGSIAVCMNRSAIFATLDEKAMRFAKTRSIHVLHLHTVLKMLLKTELCSEKDVVDIIKKRLSGNSRCKCLVDGLWWCDIKCLGIAD